MDKQNHPALAGRPPKVILHSEVERLAGLGLTVAQIADRIGVARRTLFARMEADQSLREAMDVGVSRAVEAAAGILQEEALKGNLTAVIFFLKTKGGFHVPKEPPPDPTPLPAHRPAPISLDHIDGMAARQIELVARARAGLIPKGTDVSD